MCWTFFFFIWCLCIQPGLMQTTTCSWDLVTSPVVFGKPVELRCTVADNASCCSERTRIWRKGSTIILTNGIPSLPSKYNETIEAANKQFSLVINDLSKEDVDVNYTCTYGNVSPQKTLTQNDSFEYHPTESECPVKIHNGELVGTLIVNMSAPYPSVTAQYGDSNFTSNLTTIITPVAGSTKFYTINSSLKGKATCPNDEKFTLSVLTGVTTTNICNNVTLCTGARNFRTDTMRPKTGGGPIVKSPSVPEKIVLNHISDRPSIRGIIGGIDTEGGRRFCEVLLVFVSIISSFIIILILFGLFPVVLRQNEHYNVVNHEKLTFECTVTSFFPVTDVYLRRNTDGYIVPSTKKERCCTTTLAFFVFDQTTLSDAGTYTCFAKSCFIIGQSSAITLNVIESEDQDQKYPGQKIDGDNAPWTVPAYLTKKKNIAVVVSALLIAVLMAVGLIVCSDLDDKLFILIVLILPLLLLYYYSWVQFKWNLCHKKGKKTGITTQQNSIVSGRQEMTDQENGDDSLLQSDQVDVGLTDLDADNQFEGGDGDATTTQEENTVEDPELEAIKARVKEMEEEAEKLKQKQKSVDEEMQMTSPTTAATGWHNRLNKKSACTGVGIYKLIPRLRREAELVATSISAEDLDREVNRRQFTLQQRLEDTWSKYLENQITTAHFLKYVGNLYSVDDQ